VPGNVSTWTASSPVEPAVAVTLLARDRGVGGLIGQVLICPMIDDRNTTVSSKQIDGRGVRDRGANLFGWSALLGERRGTDDVSRYAAPARATDLSGLPPAFIDTQLAHVVGRSRSAPEGDRSGGASAPTVSASAIDGPTEGHRGEISQDSGIPGGGPSS